MVQGMVNWVIHDWDGRVTGVVILAAGFETIVASYLLARNRKGVLPPGLGTIIDSIPAIAALMPMAVCVWNYQTLWLANSICQRAGGFSDLNIFVAGFVEIFIPFFFALGLFFIFFVIWFVLRGIHRSIRERASGGIVIQS